MSSLLQLRVLEFLLLNAHKYLIHLYLYRLKLQFDLRVRHYQVKIELFDISFQISLLFLMELLQPQYIQQYQILLFDVHIQSLEYSQNFYLQTQLHHVNFYSLYLESVLAVLVKKVLPHNQTALFAHL